MSEYPGDERFAAEQQQKRNEDRAWARQRTLQTKHELVAALVEFIVSRDHDSLKYSSRRARHWGWGWYLGKALDAAQLRALDAVADVLAEAQAPAEEDFDV